MRENESQLVFKRGAETTLSEIFRVLFRAERLKIRTAVPCTVQSYVPATQRARVRVDMLTKRYTDDGSVVNDPIVVDVPVRFPRTTFGYLYFPVAKDDKGHIIVSDRSLDNWMRNGGDADDPKLLHTHNLIDGIFEPGLHPSDKPITGVTANDAAVLEAVLLKLGVNATEAAVLGNAFAGLYNAFVSAYNTHTHEYVPGNLAPAITTPPATAPGVPETPQPSMGAAHLSSKVLIE